MAKKGDDDWGKLLGVLGIAAGAGLLYFALAGPGKENDAALIPNSIEGKIDLVVERLNDEFGKQWVDRGLNALKSYLQKTLPQPVVALVDVIYLVELESRQRAMSSPTKQQAAVRMARGY